jgi:putative oxidoreductase
MARLAAFLLSALRIVAAFSFVTHGTIKLFGQPGGRAPVAWMSQLGLAGGLEMVGGLLLLVGLFTRPVAFVLAGEMAAAFVQAHLPRGPWPILNGGELATLYCFIWLYISAAGPGPISLDAAIFGKPRRLA